VGTHRIGFGADGNYQGYGGTENTYVRDGYFSKTPGEGSDEWDATRWHGVYLDDTWRIHRQVDFYLGLRYEDYYGDRQVDTVLGYNAAGKPTGFGTAMARFDEDSLLPKVGLVYRPRDHLSLHGRFARATRFPDNPAFYWYYGGYSPEVDPTSDVVRSDLTYEDALQYEAGIRYTGIPGLSASLTGYYYDVDDYIRWIFGYVPSRVVYNIDSVSFQGVEVELEGRIYGNISGFANFTWQETEKSGDVLDGSNALTDSLSELPELKFNCGVQYRREDGALAKVTLRWVDEREVPYIGDPGAPFSAAGSAPEGTALGKDVTLIKLDDFFTVDLLFKYPAWKGERVKGFLSAGVENVFDEDYKEEFDFPAPGRIFHIGAEVTF
jgi:outer membrane receptor protein involved in Fe transport